MKQKLKKKITLFTTVIFNLLLLMISCTNCSACKTPYSKKEKISFPHLEIETDNKYKMYDINFKLRNNKLLLSKKEGAKLLSNINTMRVAYVKMTDKYKLAIQNYNDLLDIMTEN